MIHPVSFASDATGLIIRITFNPGGTTTTGNSISVTVTANAGSKIRWKVDSGAWTTIIGLSAVATVPLTAAGHTLNADVLDGNDNVLTSHFEDYYKFVQEGGN